MNNSSALNVVLTQKSPVSINASLYCEPGELLCLLGPSGAGKTSVLRAIAGLSKPDDGIISCGSSTWFDSTNQIFVKTQQRRVGYVFQQYSLFPHLTARQNVEQGLRHLPRKERKQRALHWLQRVNLSRLEDRRPSQLSGGQQQRVGLARALARDPSVLLLDEPFSSVDSATRDRLYTELASLRKDLSIPAVLVTHDLQEASMLSDRLSMMSQGKTLQSGKVQEVINRPQSVLVARLVGFKNVFRATVLKLIGNNALIEWRGQRLNVIGHNGFSIGSAVHWCIQQSHVELHGLSISDSAFGSSSEQARNLINGRVSAVTKMGENAIVSVLVGNPDRPPVSISLPLYLAERHAITIGADVRFTLLATSIHLMPSDRLGRSRM